jgi:hypothetical protein
MNMARAVHVEFLEGLGGDFTSAGVLAMAAQVRKLGSNFSASVRRWYQWRAAAAALKASPARNGRAVVGYSNGGSEVTGISDEGFALDLVIALDPTIWIACSPLHANVKQAICVHNVNPLSSFPPVGHASLTTAADFKGTLRTIDTWDLHINVDSDPVIQGVVLSAIKQLAI